MIPELGDKLGMSKYLSATILVPLVVSFNNFLYILHSEDTDHGIDCLETGSILMSLFISVTLVVPLCALRSNQLKYKLQKKPFFLEMIMIVVALLFILLYALLG